MRNPKVMISVAGALCNLLKHPGWRHLHQIVSADISGKKESSFHKTKECPYVIGGVQSLVGVFLGLWQLWLQWLQAIVQLATRGPLKFQCLSHRGPTIYSLSAKVALVHTRRGHFYLPSPGLPPDASLNMLALLLLLLTSPLVWADLPPPKTYCEPSPRAPPLDSCERVLILFGNIVRNAAVASWTFGPAGTDADLIMPWAAMDRGPGVANENRCTVIVEWDPQPESPEPPSPPVIQLDDVWADDLEESANRIMEKCIRKVSPGGLRQVGHEWVEYLQWVKLGYMSGWQAGVDGDLITGAANWTNGTHMNLSTSMVNEGNSI